MKVNNHNLKLNADSLDIISSYGPWISKTYVKFIKMALNWDNVTVRTIINVGLNGTYCIISGNWRHFSCKCRMEECNVMQSWDEKCKNEWEFVNR